MKTYTVNDYFEEERKLFMHHAVDNNYFSIMLSCLRYHYTNIKAVQGILDSKCLWLTHFSGLNDLSEGKYVLGELKDKIEHYDDIYRLMTSNLYMSSFCFFGNLLSQWCRYGDINIGFDYENLKRDSNFIEDAEEKNLDTSGTQFIPCSYAAKDDEDYINRLEQVKNLLSGLNPESTSAEEIPKTQMAILTAGMMCFAIKHVGFQEEGESRIIAYLWNRKPFTYKGKQFIKLSFDPQRIKRVVIGPSAEQDKNFDTMLEYLSRNEEYQHVELVKSTIPYKSSKRSEKE